MNEAIPIYLSSIFLLLFGSLGVFDGFYYHIWKFKLFAHPESRREHTTHAIRSLLFVGILYLLFLNNFHGHLLYLGVLLVFIDLAILFWDLWAESDSRKRFGGLPRGEYIIHIFVNGFHFIAIALILAAKPWSAWQIGLSNGLLDSNTFHPSGLSYPSALSYPWMTTFIAGQLLPGAILLTVLHFLLMFSDFQKKWFVAQSMLIQMFGKSKVAND